MAKDRTIRKTGRANRHLVYQTSDGSIQPGGSTLAGLVQFGSADPLIKWGIRLHDEGVDFESYRREAADFGTCFHKVVECRAKGEPFPTGSFPGDYVAPSEKMAQAFFDTLERLGLVVVDVEVVHVSDADRWGGMMDLVLAYKQTPDKPEILGDLKSSNSITTSHVIQVAGCYRRLFREKYGVSGPRVILFRADRDHLSCTEHEVPAPVCTVAEEAAKLARSLWELKPVLTRRI